MTSFPPGAELFRVAGRTDMTKVIVPFRNFAKAPTKRRDSTLISSAPR